MNSTVSPFDPVTIGPLTLRNRFIKSGANEAMCLDGKPTKALVKELDIRFAFIYPQADFATVLELLGHGRVDAKPMISDRIGLSEFSNAFEALKQPNQQIKVMLEPN